jgi:hypothetical protein
MNRVTRESEAKTTGKAWIPVGISSRSSGNQREFGPYQLYY